MNWCLWKLLFKADLRSVFDLALVPVERFQPNSVNSAGLRFSANARTC